MLLTLRLPAFTVAALLLCCCYGTEPAAAIQDRRIFHAVRADEILCDANDPLPDCEGNPDANDCYLVEESPWQEAGGNILEGGEWNRMMQAMQSMASESRLSDTYPSAMSDTVFQPLSNLRDRYCPVAYRLDMVPNRFPVLIMQADCLHGQGARCQGPLGDSCICRPVLHYRQIYRQLSEACRFTGAKHLLGSVFIKAFANVSVNCSPVKHVS